MKKLIDHMIEMSAIVLVLGGFVAVLGFVGGTERRLEALETQPRYEEPYQPVGVRPIDLPASEYE